MHTDFEKNVLFIISSTDPNGYILCLTVWYINFLKYPFFAPFPAEFLSPICQISAQNESL